MQLTISNIGLLLMCISSVFSISCFQCNSGLDGECAHLSENDTQHKYYKECPDSHGGFPSFCRKSVYQITDDTNYYRVNRECGWLTFKDNTTRCYSVDTDTKLEVNCQCFKDACNTAPSQFSAIVSLILFFALALIASC